MGLTSSKHEQESPPVSDIVAIASKPQHHVRQASIRSRSAQPMPDTAELDRRFTKVLASMDLPPDKAKLLKNYDDEKKWDIICDQDMVHAKDPPSYYLRKLRTYLDPKASRSHRKRKMVMESTSTQVLRDLEISLRTNHIEWVREFLDERNRGLDALVDYLGFRLGMMRHERRPQQDAGDSRTASEERLAAGNCSLSSTMTGTMSPFHHSNGGTMSSLSPSGTISSRGTYRPSLATIADSPGVKRRSRHAQRLNMGAATDDIHVCIMCLRAIMNNKYGFNMVIQHQEAINSIAQSLAHRSLRTKALALELLAAICLVKGGHRIILGAFDAFKEARREPARFVTLMDYFVNYETFHIEFMVACMQFVNVVVHSVDDMNFRVHLQYEFTALGLDEHLERLRVIESEELQTQISAYLDNVFDVAALVEDSVTKTAALERVGELEDELSHCHDRMSDLEHESLCKIAELERAIQTIRQERDQAIQQARQHGEEVATLRRESKQLKENERKMRGNSDSSLTTPDSTSGNISIPAPPPAPPAPPPPPPPASVAPMPPSFCPPPPTPPNMSSLSCPAPPAPPGMMQAPEGAMTIKRKVQTKYKLPTLNWIALKPNQVRGTIFNELDDDKLFNHIDFTDFEERFKLGPSLNGTLLNGHSDTDGLSTFPSKRFKKPENISLLEHTRLRNIAISRRKLEMPVEKVIAAINSLDLKQLPLDNVELLQRMVPTETETKAYREYQNEKKNINQLTDEDKFLLNLTKVERITAKLNIMNYIGNFFDNVHLVTPQIHAVISGSASVKSSQKLRKILEIILAFGNYLNSSKRGPAYGFKLQSLDTLLDTKSADKRICLLHYITSTIRQKFPDLLNFDTELLYIDKAAQVSLENINADMENLEKGMELIRKEAEQRSKNSAGPNIILKDFLQNSEDKLRKLKAEAKTAQESFKECVEYFGESHRTVDANTFFNLIVRFIKAFKTADQDNEQRRRLELAALEALNKPNEEVIKKNKINQKKQQDAVINELKHKTNQVREKKLLQQDEVYNGALEDILLGLKSEPYRRADAVRRSQRRKIDNRLSKTLEELEF